MFASINRLMYKNTEVTSDTINEFSPYMTNRWISFYDTQQAVMINEVFNKHAPIFEDKYDQFKFYDALIPKLRYKKMQYVKKPKELKEKDKEENLIQHIARSNEISTREVREYIDLHKHITK